MNEMFTPFLEAALSVVDSTDAMIRERLSVGFSFRHKPDRSFVTDVDLEVERFVRGELGRRFPEHGVLGEELGSIPSSGRFTWVVDPIDGTMSLRHGIPLFGTLLALLDGDEPVVGVVSLPGIGNRAWAAKGEGAFVDGVAIRLEDVDDVEDEVIAIGERRQFLAIEREEDFDRLMKAHPGVRVYCDCFGHLLALRGAVGAMVDYGLRIWDCAASRIIMTEAGGSYAVVGERTIDRHQRYDIVMGKPRVVDWVKSVIRRV